MKLITIITILLLISIFILIVSKRENFSNLNTIGDNKRIVPYYLKLNFNNILEKYNDLLFTTDADGNPIDENITGCEDYRSDYLKYGEQIGPGEQPLQYKDVNDNTCDYYRENPSECRSTKAFLNSPDVEESNIASWARRTFKDSPRDVCYVKDSVTDYDDGCSGGYFIKPYITKTNNTPFVYLRNLSKDSSLRTGDSSDFFPNNEANNLKLKCYRVVDDLGYNKTKGKCVDKNNKYPNFKEVTIPGTQSDYVDLSNKCNEINECQGFQIDLKNSRARYFGNTPYFDNEGTDKNTIIENGDGDEDFECYKKKNFNVSTDNYNIMSGKCGNDNMPLRTNYGLQIEEETNIPQINQSGETNTGEPTTESTEDSLLNKCKYECDNTPECLGFNLNKFPSGQISGCELFGERPDWVPTEDWNTEYNVSKMSPMNINQGVVQNILNRTAGDTDCYKKINNNFKDDNFIVTSGTCRSGVGLNSNPPILKSNETKENCRKICVENPTCQGFAYNDETSTCKLFGYIKDESDIPPNDPNNSDRLHIKIERGNPRENDIRQGEDLTPENFKFEKCYKKINYTHYPNFSQNNGKCLLNGTPDNNTPMDDGKLNENCARECLEDISCQGFTLDKTQNSCIHHGYIQENPINSENLITPGESSPIVNNMCYKKLDFDPILQNTIHNSNQNHSPKYGKCRSSNGRDYPGNYNITNVVDIKQCADLCGNSRETPNKCQGFDYNYNTQTCTFYGNDRSKYNNLEGAVDNSIVLTGNRSGADGKKSVCYINNKFTPVNKEILNN